MKKTKFLFDSPVTKDWMFYVFLVFLAANLVNGIQNVNSSGGLSTSPFGIVSGLIDGAFRVFLSWFPIIPIIYAIRKQIRKKTRGIQEQSQEPEIDNNDAESPNKKGKVILVVSAILFVVILFSIGLRGTDTSEGDRFFEEQKRISKIAGEWNREVAPLISLIQAISDGSVSVTEAQETGTDLQSRLSPILMKLGAECADVPNEEITGQGEQRAIQLSWRMLFVLCEVTPQQYTETLSIYKAQISATGTQEDIDYHVAQLSALGERKKAAAREALDAFAPYASPSELANIERMRALLGS